MKQEQWLKIFDDEADKIKKICIKASEIHEDVNQSYGGDKPYIFHLLDVFDCVKSFGFQSCNNEEDVLGIVAGALFHDSIEDARLTYNDVKSELKLCGLSVNQVFIGSEIAYALTNEKGRTRAERANEKYYEGIRSTKYAPMVKYADRIANLRFSVMNAIKYESKECIRKAKMYIKEMDHFNESVIRENVDIEYTVPKLMIEQSEEIISQYNEKYLN